MKFNYIASSPDFLRGKPHIKNSQISVENILEWLASGTSFKDLIVHYPALNEEILREALLFAKQALAQKAQVAPLPLLFPVSKDNTFNLEELCRTYSPELCQDVDNTLSNIRNEWERDTY